MTKIKISKEDIKYLKLICILYFKKIIYNLLHRQSKMYLDLSFQATDYYIEYNMNEIIRVDLYACDCFNKLIKTTTSYKLKNNNLHRTDGPAYLRYCYDNTVWNEIYYINGVMHRDDGPAEIYYDDKRNILQANYYFDGNHISNELIKTHPEILTDKNLRKILL